MSRNDFSPMEYKTRVVDALVAKGVSAQLATSLVVVDYAPLVRASNACARAPGGVATSIMKFEGIVPNRPKRPAKRPTRRVPR